MEKAQIRLECLSLASKLNLRTADSALSLAEEFYNWVTVEDKPKQAPRATASDEAADKAKAPAKTAGKTAATKRKR